MPSDQSPNSPDQYTTQGEAAPTTAPPGRAVTVHGRDVLGHYELRREVGRGGMGTVYEAWDRSLERPVAVKVLHPHISASQVSIERFQREARAVARLRHMHITPIYAQDEEEGVHYYVMEFVEGRNLHEIIGEARGLADETTTAIDLDETVDLRRPSGDTSDSKAETESQVPLSESATPTPTPPDAAPVTIIHRSDEETSRIVRHVATVADALYYAHLEGVIHRDIKPHNLILGTDGHMRITDFGLARVARQPGVTLTGEVLGSPLYMSPEQILGAPGSVDHRSDIYSLGVTMYEWLTLSPPYPGETREQVIGLIANSEPIPVCGRCPDIPTDLETICMKAIERDPGRRYQSADEFADDLRRFLLKKPIKAARPSIISRAARYVRRHPIGGVLTIALLVTAALLWALKTERGEKASAQMQLDEATAAAVEEKALNDQLVAAFEAIMPVELGGLVSGAEAAAPMVQGLVASVAGEQGASLAAAATPKGIARRAARDLYNAVGDEAVPFNGEVSEDSAQLLSLAKSKWGAGSDAEREALTLLRVFLGTYPTHFEALQLRAAIYACHGDTEGMIADVEALVTHYGANPVAHVWRGLAHVLTGDAESALSDLSLAATYSGPKDWVTAVRALALIELGRPAEATSILTDLPELIVAMLARATALAADGHPEQAVADLSRVAELEPDNADVLAIRGQYYGALGDFGSAAADFEKAMEIAGRTTELNALWTVAAVQHRKLQNAQTTHEQDTEDENSPESDDADASSQRVQEWFSRYVYPRTIDTTKHDVAAPSLTPQSPYSPHEPQ